jgi:diaminohydroxyphosphoribosylaminopyrimidine deaminase/5-amino-6-(5-phosphoribosylamino)uracil reductase
LPRAAKILTGRAADRSIIFRGKSLRAVLRELGKKEITSVLIEGGGDVLGQALDSRLIDKVQLYVGRMFTGGPVPAFAGRGAAGFQSAPRLDRVVYEQIRQDVCVTGYPIYPSSSAE